MTTNGHKWVQMGTNDDDIYFRYGIIPLFALTFWGLVGYEFAPVVKHPTFKIDLGTPLNFDNKLFSIIRCAGKVI